MFNQNDNIAGNDLSGKYDFKKLRSQMLNEHNRLRADPQSYIPFVEKYQNYVKIYKNNSYLCIPGNRPIKMIEGVEGIKKTIEFLKSQNPVKTLTFDKKVSKASQGFAEYLGNNGLTSQVDKDGLNVGERIEKFCEWESVCAENIEYGFSSAQNAIISLLIDDGVVNKKRRNVLFDEKLKFVGIGISVHKFYENIVIIDYTGGLRSKGEPYFDLESRFVNNVRISLELQQYKLKMKQIENFKSSEKISKETFYGKVKKTSKYIYELADGTNHIIEVEDLINT